MKFPKSVHAEGWDHHFDGAEPAINTHNPALNVKRGFKAGAKPVSLHTPLQGDVPAAMQMHAKQAGSFDGHALAGEVGVGLAGHRVGVDAHQRAQAELAGDRDDG